MARLANALKQLRRNRRTIVPDRDRHFGTEGLTPIVTGDPSVFDGVDATAEELIAYVETKYQRERRKNAVMLQYAVAGLATEMTMHEANSLLNGLGWQTRSLMEKEPARFARMDADIRRLSDNFNFLTNFKAHMPWGHRMSTAAGVLKSVEYEFGRAIGDGTLVIEATDAFRKSEVHCDERILHAVFINLVRNSYQWAHKSETKPIIVRFDSERIEHEVTGWDDETETETKGMGHTDILVVEDNGPGLAPDAGDEIFQPGVSGRKSSGIGLYLCKAGLESKGYTIIADGQDRSELGGAKFRIGNASILRPAYPFTWGNEEERPVETVMAEALESMAVLLENGHTAEVVELADVYQDASGAAMRIRLRGAETGSEERLIAAVDAFEEAMRSTRPIRSVVMASPSP
jgi:signal transduction histidine kinase|nr:ATP-binding protein [Neorhizobium tomejilense]